MSADRPLIVLRATAEPVLALAAAFVVTVLLTLPFVPTSLEAEFPLRAEVDAGSRDTHAELVERIESLELARSVEVLLKDGESKLVLRGVAGTEGLEAPVGEALEEAGFRRDEPQILTTVSLDDLLRSGAERLPLLMTIQAVVFSIVGFAMIRSRLRGMPPRPVTGPLRAAFQGIVAGLAAVGISAVLSFLLEALGLPVQEQEWLAELFHDPWTLVKLAPWIVIVGPFSEEIFFRGYAFGYIREKAGFAAGLLVSSVLFAAIHFNLSGFLVYLAIGCSMGWVYNRTNSLVAPMVGHATANSIVLMISGIAANLEG
jgi:membrane protease YdiL (CAAX protease family)